VYQADAPPPNLKKPLYAMDSTMIDLCLSLFLWDVPAPTIAQIYRQRWKIELFFKWLNQNLSVKHFFGNSINAVKSQIRIAVCVCLMTLIAQKTLKLELSLQLFPHLVKVKMFKKIPIREMVHYALSAEPDRASDSQMKLI